MRRRLVVSVLIGLTTGLLCYRYQWAFGNGGAWDFTWALRAAADLLSGADPYRHKAHVNAIPYPLPAALVALPFVALPPAVAAGCFIGCSSALLAFGLTRDQQWWRLLVFLALPFLQSIMVVQWAPLLFAVALYPSLMPLTLCKPTLGAAVALPRLTWRRVLATVALGLLTLLIQPNWPLRWLAQTQSYGGFVPLLTLPGLLLPLALLRWRTSAAQTLLVLALAPQRLWYDQLLVFLVPETPRSLAILVAGSWLGYMLTSFGGPAAVVACLYLPALGYVLWPWKDLAKSRSWRQANAA